MAVWGKTEKKHPSSVFDYDKYVAFRGKEWNLATNYYFENLPGYIGQVCKGRFESKEQELEIKSKIYEEITYWIDQHKEPATLHHPWGCKSQVDDDELVFFGWEILANEFPDFIHACDKCKEIFAIPDGTSESD